MEVNDGFLILNKSKNCTSHDCVKRIKRIFNIKKVGHTGTLDPQVTGVLPMALGNATKFIQYLPQDKTYRGIIKLGITTDTDDIHGEIIHTKNWPVLNKGKLEKYLDSFRGTFKQVPPKLSSVHINGERAYKKFFKEEEYELPSKEVTINQLILHDWDQENGKIELEITCSAGTYIRSIARDLGETLESGGCLYELERTMASGFGIKDSSKLDILNIPSTDLNKLIIPTIDGLNHLPKFQLKDSEDELFWQTGRRISIDIDKIIPNINPQYDNPIKVINNQNTLVGIGFVAFQANTYLQPKLVLNAK